MGMSRRIWARITAVVIAPVAMLAALIAGVLLPYYLSVDLAQTWLLVLFGVLSFAAIAWLGMRLCAALWRAGNPTRLASVSAGLLTGAFLIALYFSVLRPVPLHMTEAIPAEGARYWQLPTGSKISYLEYTPPAGVTVQSDPIVFLHGGPGLRFAPFDSEVYRKFADDGFRVYLYDQAGSGASPTLEHIRDYSVARFVEDLEAIRLQIHAERMILIGHSWGSTLAASYMAKYPTHVSKVVFHSPGAIWNIEGNPTDSSLTDMRKEDIVFPPLRFLAGLYLMQQNPDAAERLLPQREAQELFAPLMAHGGRRLVCKGNSSKLPPLIAALKDLPDNPGFNPYVLQRLIDQTEVPQGDPRAALRGNTTPAILLLGECNFLAWEDTVDYRKTFANLKIFYIPKAGHYLQFEQPELMVSVIRSFLLGLPEAIPPYTDDVDPRRRAHGSGGPAGTTGSSQPPG